MTAHLSTESAFPDYWKEALFYLSERDPVMKRLIERYRHIEFTAHESGILLLWLHLQVRCAALVLILEKSRR